jgi:4,5-dihydroxyphthalate decarboxylase
MANRRMLDLSIALTDNVRTRPIIEGRTAPEAIRLTASVMGASEMFWRQLRFAEFDVSEMSLSSLFIAVSRGDLRWAALPVYTMRRFFHTWTWVRADRGIEQPSDLRGQRVGVPEYQQTAAVWARGVLQHEFGVHPREIEWYMERTPETSHGGATGFTPPDGVRVNRIPSNTNIGEMLVSGELAATLLYLNQANIIDRSRIDLASRPEVRPLFRNELAEGRRFFAKTGLYPINHAVVVRRSLLEQHPWIALNLLAAFEAAKRDAVNTAQGVLDDYARTGSADIGLMHALRTDPMPYGVKAARRELETLADYVHEQGLSARRVSIEEVFAPSTLDV